MVRSTGVSRVRQRNNKLVYHHSGEDEKKIEIDDDNNYASPSSPSHRSNHAVIADSNKQFRSISRSPRAVGAAHSHHAVEISSRVSCAAILLILFLSGMMVIFIILLQNSLTVPWLSQQDAVPNIHFNVHNPKPIQHPLVRREQVSKTIINADSTLTINATTNHSKTLYKEVHQQPKERPFLPRIVFLEGTPDQYYPPRSTLHYPEELSGFVQDDWNPPEHHERCVPKADWQISSHPNCNSIHEIPLVTAAREVPTNEQKHHHHHHHHHHPDSQISTHKEEEEVLTPLGEGWFRTTWKLEQHDRPSVVLKTLRIAREFLSEYYELHRRDAVAMERLTASEFVVNIYGYCGQSAVNELADFPYPNVQNLESFDRRMRAQSSHNNPKLAAIKLRMAASIALGLADIHAGGSTDPNDTKVYMAHYDMNPRNIALFVGGRPKINDFNIAEFLRYDPQTNQTCKFPSRLHEPWWRAPEEMDVNHTIWVDEKVDMYALGNILYHILTTHSARGKQIKERMDSVRPIVASGILPAIPHEYTQSHDRNIQAILKAIHMCWIKEPEKRASADQVAELLFQALLNNTAENSPSFKEFNQQARDGNEKLNLTNNDSDDDSNEADVEDKNAMADPNAVDVFS